MANVMFKRGLQASLPTGSSILDGVFYLTTDTGRLYVGQDNNGTKALVELNKSITTVTSIQAASGGGYEVVTPASGIRPVTSGEFYYLASGNMLLIGQDNGKLLQINPDTDIHVGSGTLTLGTEASTGYITLNGKIYNTNADGSAQTTTAAVDQTVKFAEGDNITLTVRDNVLTIEAADSVLAADTATDGVNLSVDQGTGVDIVGAGGTTVSMVNGKVQISSGDTSGFTYTISGYTDGAAGSANSNSSKGRRKIHLANGDNTSTSDVYLPITEVVLGGTASDTSTIFAPTVDADGYDVITLPVYSKKEIEEKLSGITSPLNYKGSTSTLPSSNQANGDVYLVSANLNNPSAKIGDLAIWNSSLNSGAGGWDIIPSGNDQNITATVGDNLLKISDTIASNTAGNIATIGYDNTQDANKTKVQFASSGTGTHDYRLSAALPVYHDSTVPAVTTTATGSISSGGSIVVPQVTIDSYGRVTGLESRTLTLPSAQTLSGSVTVPASGDQSFSISLSDNGGTAQFYTKTLTVSTDNGHNYIDLTWGEF